MAARAHRPAPHAAMASAVWRASQLSSRLFALRSTPRVKRMLRSASTFCAYSVSGSPTVRHVATASSFAAGRRHPVEGFRAVERRRWHEAQGSELANQAGARERRGNVPGGTLFAPSRELRFTRRLTWAQ
jgi:hypothetical protein